MTTTTHPTAAMHKPDAAQLQAFRALDADAQLRQLRGLRVERTFTVERDGIDKEARTAWLSIASEEPYTRWWGIEILDCRKGAIREGRLKAGAPFLVGHDTADMVGVVEDYQIASDRKLRILVRFGRSARAEEIWQDVLDDIRRNTSVGYIIHDLVLERSEDGVNTYRVTDWEPYEGSTVPVPADYTVGLGRAHETNQSTERNTMQTPEQIAAAAAAKSAAEAAQREAVMAAVKREQDRIGALLAAGKQFADHDGVAIAADMVKDPAATVDQFNAKMLEKMRGVAQPLNTAAPAPAVPHGSGARHLILRGGQLRAFRQPLMFSDGTKMEALECAYRSAQWLLATVGKSEKAAKWCTERGIFVGERVMTTDSGPAGGYLVPDEMEQSIIDLRESYGLARRLARRRTLAGDTKSVPKRTGGVTAYFIDEDNAGATAADKSWGNVNFVAKRLAALSLISSNLEEDAAIDVVDDLVLEQAYAFATKEDQCWLIADGTSTYGGMVGLITLFEASALASRYTAASGHDTFAEIDTADLAGVRSAQADLPGLMNNWLASKAFAELVMMRLKAAAGGNTVQSLGGRPAYDWLGDPVDTSEIMRKDPAEDVSGKVVALYGDFSKSSSFADRRGIFVQVLRERYAEKFQIGILSSERFQIQNHDVGSTTAKGPVAALYGAS